MKHWMFLIAICILAIGISAHEKMSYDQKAKEAQVEFQKLTEQITALEARREQLKGRFNLLVELKKEAGEEAAEIKKAGEVEEALKKVAEEIPEAPGE